MVDFLLWNLKEKGTWNTEGLWFFLVNKKEPQSPEDSREYPWFTWRWKIAELQE